jgi:hypothetical protein
MQSPKRFASAQQSPDRLDLLANADSRVFRYNVPDDLEFTGHKTEMILFL